MTVIHNCMVLCTASQVDECVYIPDHLHIGILVIIMTVSVVEHKPSFLYFSCICKILISFDLYFKS